MREAFRGFGGFGQMQQALVVGWKLRPNYESLLPYTDSEWEEKRNFSFRQRPGCVSLLNGVFLSEK